MQQPTSPKGASHIGWILLALVGAACLGVVALRRGEPVNAIWLVAAAVSIYLVAYRYYSLFIANKVMGLDPRRATPAVLNNDGMDYVPTNKHVLFGHHFAAIAGAGPLVGPVLAAQMGYLPGTLWLIAGVVLAGAVQDFMVLFISTRRNGRSLGELVREEMGQVPGTIALFGAYLIMIIILAVLALIVVKALAESPWGMFTVMATMPIALFMTLRLFRHLEKLKKSKPGRFLLSRQTGISELECAQKSPRLMTLPKATLVAVILWPVVLTAIQHKKTMTSSKN